MWLKTKDKLVNLDNGLAVIADFFGMDPDKWSVRYGSYESGNTLMSGSQGQCQMFMVEFETALRGNTTVIDVS